MRRLDAGWKRLTTVSRRNSPAHGPSFSAAVQNGLSAGTSRPRKSLPIQ
jgi:hypothetical protein